MSRKPLVSNLSMSFRNSVRFNEDNEEAKKEHRNTLHEMIESYKQGVAKGTVEGIRHARDLIEVMKMDLVLMGEASDRTENVDGYDEVRMTQLSTLIDEDDPEIQNIMQDLMQGLNDMNDREDVINKGVDTEEVEEREEGDQHEP